MQCPETLLLAIMDARFELMGGLRQTRNRFDVFFQKTVSQICISLHSDGPVQHDPCTLCEYRPLGVLEAQNASR